MLLFIIALSALPDREIVLFAPLYAVSQDGRRLQSYTHIEVRPPRDCKRRKGHKLQLCFDAFAKTFLTSGKLRSLTDGQSDNPF